VGVSGSGAKPDEIERLNERVRAELAKVEAAAEEARREHLIRVAPSAWYARYGACAATSRSLDAPLQETTLIGKVSAS
jgi:hypothetical protein